MKTSAWKRLLSFLLTVVMILGLVPVVALPKAEAAASYTTVYSTIQNMGYPVATRVPCDPKITGDSFICEPIQFRFIELFTDAVGTKASLV